jgi:sugar lactone lactonase YvrE
MNEGAADPDGRFYCGSMAYDTRAGAAALYRLDPDGSVAVVLEGVTISNGLDWSPNGSQAYYNDTPTRRTDVFDYDIDAGLTGRRIFARVDGHPDGLVVDSEAASGSRCTAVVRSNGSLLTVPSTPSSSCP